MEQLNSEKQMNSGDLKNTSVSIPRIESEILESKEVKEVENILLEPDQIEEIHADEYSLMLFSATRIEPLSLLEIKRKYPEPEPKKAQSIMNRFLEVGLIRMTKDGKYYSNYPENYIDYSKYRYDSHLEARKDGKVFKTMKEQSSNKPYWSDRVYFSIDAFFSEEQTKELREHFREIRRKAKEFSNENMKNQSVKGLQFRRLKIYDIYFSLVFFALLSVFSPGKSMAGGGNDPGMYAAEVFPTSYSSEIYRYFSNDSEGGGHDPGGIWPTPFFNRGGGHDPGSGDNPYISKLIGSGQCFWNFDGKVYVTNDRRVCRLAKLKRELQLCEKEKVDCSDLKKRFDDLDKEIGNPF